MHHDDGHGNDMSSHLVQPSPASSPDSDYLVQDLSLPAKSVADFQNDIGFGRAQILLMMVSGMMFAVEASEVFLLTFIKKDIIAAYGVSESETTALTSCFFLGILIGALVVGRFADSYGRRPAMLIVILLPLIVGLLSAIATSFWLFFLCRFVIGIGVGAAHVAPLLLTEMLPTQRRGIYVIASYSFWSVGVLYLTLCAFLLKDSSWRYLVIMATLPYLLCLFAFPFVVPESPHWLSTKRRLADARWELAQLARVNSKTLLSRHPLHMPDTVEAASETMREQITSLFGFLPLFKAPLTRVTLLLSCFWLCITTAYYATIMLSTETLFSCGGANRGESYAAIAAEGAGELVVFPAMMYVSSSQRFGRKSGMWIGSVVAAAGIVCMRLLYTDKHDFSAPRYDLLVIASIFTRGVILFAFNICSTRPRCCRRRCGPVAQASALPLRASGALRHRLSPTHCGGRTRARPTS